MPLFMTVMTPRTLRREKAANAVNLRDQARPFLQVWEVKTIDHTGIGVANVTSTPRPFMMQSWARSACSVSNSYFQVSD